MSQNLEFIPPRNYRSSRKSSYRWLFSHIKRHKLLLLIGLTFQIANVTLQSVVPTIIGDMVAKYYAGTLDRHTITTNSVLILIMLVATAFIQFARSSSFETIGAKLERDARDELYTSLLGKSLTFHDKQKIGDIMSRVTQDVRQLTLFMNPGVNLIFMGFTFVLVPLIFISAINSQFIITSVVFFILYLFLAKRYNDQLTPPSIISREVLSDATSRLNEALTGIHVVKGASGEEYEEKFFEEKIEEYRDAEVRIGYIRGRYWPILIFGLTLTYSVLHGYFLYESGELQLNQLVELVLLFQLVNLGVFLNSFAVSALSLGFAASERIFELIEGESELELNSEGYREPIVGNIEFKNVSFSYGGANALSHVSFNIKPGQTVALVGVTGSGKSTITKLLGRMYDPAEGEILIDGINLKEWSMEHLRNQFAVVEQDIFLFSRTIRENITFGLSDISEERILEAAKLANADDFIIEMPEGYDTFIGERGVTLSGGQKQRIAIARAIIRNPRVLILDDSSSALDSKTEDEINHAIRNVLRGRVSFIITHRIAQIRKADVIIILDKGQISAIGNHQELLSTSSKYKEIFSIFDEEVN